MKKAKQTEEFTEKERKRKEFTGGNKMFCKRKKTIKIRKIKIKGSRDDGLNLSDYTKNRKILRPIKRGVNVNLNSRNMEKIKKTKGITVAKFKEMISG